jgi:uncharacterized protein (TIGR03435 family)
MRSVLVGLGMVFVGSVVAQTGMPRETFDAASIKPNSMGGRGGGPLEFTPGRVSGRAATIRRMIIEAYHLQDYQLPDGPTWIDSDRFDLEAKAGIPASEDQLRSMLQTLLADRCKLVVHRQPKEMLVYALVVGKNGPRFSEVKENDPGPPKPPSGMKFLSLKMTMAQFVEDFFNSPIGARYIGRPVLDKTGLTGRYLIELTWAPDDDLIANIREQLGLNLESQKAAVDTLVIDHIEKPAAN